MNFGYVLKMLQCLLDIHFQYFMDVFVLESDL